MNKIFWIGVSTFVLGFFVGRLFDRDPARDSTKPDRPQTPGEVRMLPSTTIIPQSGHALTVRDSSDGEWFPNENGTRDESESLDDAAARFANLEPTATMQSWALSRFTARLYRERPEEAIAWVLALEEQGGVFESAFRALGEEMARNGEFERVVKLVEELPSSPGVDALFDGLLIATAKIDPGKALQVRILNPDLGKHSDQSNLLGLAALSGRSHEAIEAVKNFLPEAQHTDEIIHIYSQWAIQDPLGAALDLQEVPPSRVKNQGLYKVVATWMRRDFAATEAWVQALEPSTAKDLAISALVDQLRSTLPNDAFALALEIQNEEIRFARLENDVAEWVAQNPEAAIQAINAADLSPGIKSQLILRRKP